MWNYKDAYRYELCKYRYRKKIIFHGDRTSGEMQMLGIMMIMYRRRRNDNHFYKWKCQQIFNQGKENVKVKKGESRENRWSLMWWKQFNIHMGSLAVRGDDDGEIFIPTWMAAFLISS